MKKILFMITSMNVGGVEKSLLSLLECIPKNKYEITLLLLEKKGGFMDYIPKNIIVKETEWFADVKPIIMDSPYSVVKKYLANKQFLKMIRYICCYFVDKYFDNRYIYYQNAMKDVPVNEQEYDVVISYQGPTDIIDYYIANKVKADKKISWVHFDVSKHSFNKKLYEKLYKKYNKIFVVSDQASQVLVEKIGSVKGKIEVFFNIVSKELIKYMANENVDFDDKYNGIKIVTVGRLSKEKGYDLAIKALMKLRKKGYEVKWYCIGDGNDRIYYQNLIKKYNLQECFILLGEKNNPYPYIKNCDIYVQPSRHEGYCLTLAEAKCLEKAIVTTNFVSASAQIEHGVNGLICDMEEESIYKNIEYLISNPTYKIKLQKNLSNEKMDTTSEVLKLIKFID